MNWSDFPDAAGNRDANRESARAEQLTREAIERAVLVGIATFDPRGRLLHANRAFCRLVGQAEEALLGARPPFAHWAPAERGRLSRTFAAVLRGAAPAATIETAFVRPDGTSLDVQICLAEILDEGGARTGWAASFGNITAVRERERQLRELNAALEERVRQRTAELEATLDALADAKEELESTSRGIIHDVGNSVVVVGLLARRLRLLHEQGATAAVAEQILRVQEHATRMESLVGELARLLRAGTEPLLPETVDLGSLARAVAAALPPNARGRSLACSAPRGLTVTADPAQLRTVLENLIGNAWKYTVGARRPRVTVGRRRDGVLFVRDNGCGFDPAHAESLFQPFFRVRGGTHATGSGLGLAIVARIVGRHGGRAWAEGTPGRGATFCFTLPASPARSGAAAG